jgi:dTDP-4-amino-4,6-dideoxygalactose transaminase
MAKSIFTSLIPNFSSRDIILSLKLFFEPWNYTNDDWGKELAQKLSAYLGVSDVVLADSGRTAEYLLLKALGIGAGDEVIIQAFTCVAVPNSVKWAGAVPIYADIDLTFNLDPDGLESRITPRTRAVIVQHTFGYPANMERVAAICKKKGLLLIEDCAHGFGGNYGGKKLGTIGDAAFMSFGRDKVISGVWGGAIVAKDAQVMVRLRKETSALPRRGTLWIAMQLMYIPLMATVMHTYRLFGIGKLLHMILKKTGIFSSVLTVGEKNGELPARFCFYGGIAPPLAKLISSQMDRLNGFIAHRRSLARYYAESFHIPYVEGHTYLRFPMLSLLASDIRKAAGRKNMFLGDWYNVVVAPDSVDQRKTGYIAGSCPRAEQAASHMLNLPTHPRMTIEDTARVAAFVKTYIQAWTLRK